MAIVRLQDAEQMTEETYNRVADKMGVRDNPPDGLVVHTAGEVDGHWRIVDVWETEEAMQRFDQERLGPAVAEVLKELGGDVPDGPPAHKSWEARSIIKG